MDKAIKRIEIPNTIIKNTILSFIKENCNLEIKIKFFIFICIYFKNFFLIYYFKYIYFTML